MPSFTIREASDLADYIIVMTPEMARETVTYAESRQDKTAVAAIYFLTGNPDKPRRESIAVTVVLDTRGDPLAFVWTGPYHPRSQGRAHFIYKTEQFIHD